MLQSFIIYSIFGLSLFFLGKIAARRENESLQLNRTNRFWVWETTLIIIIFSIVSGVRWHVGVDYMSYLNNYLSVQNFGHSIFNKESGFEYITLFFAKLGLHYTVYFTFLAFLQIYFIYRAFQYQRFLYPILGLFIVFGPFYLEWMNGIRQVIAASMFVYSIRFIIEKKLFKYLITILLASLFHQSVLILIPVYFLPKKDLFKNRFLTLSLVFISLYLGMNNFWIDQLKNLGNLFQLIGYENYSSDNLATYIMEEQIQNIGPRRLIMILIAIITIWYAPKLSEHFKKYHFYYYFNLAIFGFLFYNLLSNTHHLFLRPVAYFTIFSVVTTSYLMVYLKDNLTKKRIFIYLVTFILMLLYLPISLIVDADKENQDYSNYRFFFEQTDY